MAMMKTDLSVGDQAPVLHGSCTEVRNGNHVLLGQREGCLEVLLVVGEDLRANLSRPLRLAVASLAGPDTEFYTVFCCLQKFMESIL